MRRFHLQRDADESGVSGTGCVAEGVVFSSGVAVLVWTVIAASVAIYPSVKALERVHGHNGKTRIIWLDAT